MKLPHWLIVGLGAVLVALTWLTSQSASGAITLPGWYPTVSSLIVVVLGALGITSTSASPSANARAAAAAKSLGVLALLALMLGCGSGCGGSGVPQVVAPTLDTFVCVLSNASTDPACALSGGNWETCTAALVKDCGTDVGSVITVLTAHASAEAKEGLTPHLVAPPTVDGGPDGSLTLFGHPAWRHLTEEQARELTPAEERF